MSKPINVAPPYSNLNWYYVLQRLETGIDFIMHTELFKPIEDFIQLYITIIFLEFNINNTLGSSNKFSIWSNDSSCKSTH